MFNRKYYIEGKESIAFLGRASSATFWDSHWSAGTTMESIRQFTTDNLFIPIIKRLLPAGSRVLEGGCGISFLVHALLRNGYNPTGIDFAQRTIESVKKAVPELDVRVGDVRKLPFYNGEFDCYISVGVIEHFSDGYNVIINEMSRVLNKGGYLLVSFPYMSILRKIKALMRLYDNLTENELRQRSDEFYQYALNSDKVIKDLQAVGFRLIKKHPYDGLKGFKDEVPVFRKVLQLIYDGKTMKLIRPYLDRILSTFSAHCLLLVMTKV